MPEMESHGQVAHEASASRGRSIWPHLNRAALIFESHSCLVSAFLFSAALRCCCCFKTWSFTRSAGRHSLSLVVARLEDGCCVSASHPLARQPAQPSDCFFSRRGSLLSCAESYLGSPSCSLLVLLGSAHTSFVSYDGLYPAARTVELLRTYLTGAAVTFHHFTKHTRQAYLLSCSPLG